MVLFGGISVNFVWIQNNANQRYSSAVYIWQNATLDIVDMETFKALYYLFNFLFMIIVLNDNERHEILFSCLTMNSNSHGDNIYLFQTIQVKL